MVPVPEALETVLIQTAKCLWLHQSCSDMTSTPMVGQISASDIHAPYPGYPNYNSSIMDGYAVRTRDVVEMKRLYEDMNENESFSMSFILEGKVFAGDKMPSSSSSSNAPLPSAVYVTTGAVVPNGYDAVIPVEDTETYSEDNISRMRIIDSKVASVLATTKQWTWIRPIGCDIAPDTIVLGEGETIQPVHMALLAQCGVNKLPVKCLPRVGVLSTGNELSISADQCQGGKIPDANRPLLLSQLSTYGNCKPHDLGMVSDDDSIEVLSDKLKTALWSDGIDILISTGGISMGEKDNMEQVFVEGLGGKVHFGRMNMKPGKPTTFITIEKESNDGNGTMCRKLIFALPGNPVSASVCTELLVRPCLDMLYHGIDTSDLSTSVSEQLFIRHCVDNHIVHDELVATLTKDVKLDKGRPEYHRVTLQRELHSNAKHQYFYHATSTGVQRSSRVMSLRSADGLMMLPRGGPQGCGQDVAQKGQVFPVLLYQSCSLSLGSGVRFKDSMHRKSMNEYSKRISLGVVFCASGKEDASGRLDGISTTLMHSLGGENHVKIVNKVVCTFGDELMVHRLKEAVVMENVDVVFVVVVGELCQESTLVPFQAGLDVAHTLRQIITKRADEMAMRLRRAAASYDARAALFENVVGLVRGDSSVLVSCTDIGLEAVTEIRGLLGHLIVTLKKD